MRKKMKTVWPQLESSYPVLKGILNGRSKLFIMGHATKNEETKLYSLDDVAIEKASTLKQVEKRMIADESYYENKEDPLVRVIGPEHGGRSRTISQIIGYTKVHRGLFKNVNHDKVLVPQVDVRPYIRVDYPPIKSLTRCELLLKVGDSLEKVADGMAWPWPSTDNGGLCQGFGG
ncbi:uncharacterized protein LOC143581238 [Bidens hawaiensis]|uniref:uncharacterized protein LOC143581238 n=1 Tax=Bidens hawaiensis TaxID=980011 RepID=UPI00404AC1A2